MTLTRLLRPARGFIAAAVILMLAGCASGGEAAPALAPILQRPQTPEDVATRFLDLWKAGDYPAMYALLSPQSQAQVSLPVFQTAYQDALAIINPTEITYALLSSRIQGASAEVLYNLSFVAPVFGTIPDNERTMRLVQSGNGWGIAWSTMDIINGMVTGSRIDLSSRRSPRAEIYDRNGSVLVEQGGTLTALYAAQQDMPNVDACLDLLARVLMRHRYDLERYFARFNPETLFYIGEIDAETDAAEGQTIRSTCGVSSSFERQTRRYVGYGGAAQVTGYISFIPQDQVESYAARGYASGELVGRTGVEREFEEFLAGAPEKVLRVISPANIVLRELAGRAGTDPLPVTLTIDRQLQMAAAQAVADAYNYAYPSGNWGSPVHSPGAGVVVLDVKTGAVRALVSFPYFDPGLFNPDTPALAQYPTWIADLQSDPRQPFTNRVTQQQYFPGSTFKIVTTAAAASEGVMNEPTFDCQIEWDGRERYGDSSSPRYDWRRFELPDSPFSKPAGPVTMSQALMASCNPFFYEMGARLFLRGPDTLTRYARQMGFGAATRINVLPEVSGSLPPTASVEQGINEAIGQGGVQVTLIQMARMVAAIANGGTLYRPYLVERIGGQDGTKPIFQGEPEAAGSIGLSDEALAVVREGMCGVVSNTELGTASFVFTGAAYTVCGKTGTAQSGRIEPYGWFVAYAPAENPEIAIAAMVEFSREGSETAAPIIRRILDAYFQQPYAPFPEWWNTIEYIPLEIPANQTGG
jgi:penicillin-binding protein 2